ncbi:aminotransferase [Leifsonia sp. ZF2019]|uniref:aminotransferase n=1 Tax=Leifsonia sp. ZF2019 TaxID=2781978 RepID=UPI001CBFAECA|nr:aminotransferase [Leifsonia sp. ZF2019]
MNTHSALPPAGLVQPTPPTLDAAEAEAVAFDGFGVRGVAHALGSHQDRNFLLRTESGRLLLKVANPGTTAEELEAQSAAAARVADVTGIRAPLSRPRQDGSTVHTFHEGGRPDGRTLNARLLEYVDGTPLAGAGHLSRPNTRAIGSLAAQVDIALAELDHPGLERVHQWDLRRAPQVLDALLPFVRDAALRGRLLVAAESAWAHVQRVESRLPVQPIHGDLTDDNLVSDDPAGRRPDGVIDFGDLNRSWRVAEPAITVSSLLHHAGGGIQTALPALAAYAAASPLSHDEAEALWPLVVLRGAVLIASAHHVLATDPGNGYAAENLTHETAIFERATALPLEVATALVIDATGHERPLLVMPEAGPLIPALAPADIAVLDFSASSEALAGGVWLDAEAETRIAVEALASGARATLTRFAEPRLTRSRPLDPAEPENAVLGVELTFAAPQQLVAPWPGVADVSPDGVELRGGGLLLRLEGAEAVVDPGTAVEAGDPVGVADGALALRVQRADATTVWATRPALVAAWRALVADPTDLLLGRAPSPTAAPADELLRRRDRAFARVQEHYFDEPPVIVRGWKQYLIDADARVYLDVLNNVSAIGHAHPRVASAVGRQLRTLNTNSRFNYPAVVEFSERLSALLPDELDSVFLVNSGSEAVELALRLARAATDREDVLTMREAYHGWTGLADAVSTSLADNPHALSTRPGWVHTVDAPNSYRGTHRGADAGAYALDAVAEVHRLAAEGTPVGAVIAETFYGNAGGIPLPDGYLASVYAAVRAHGGVTIADEVQVGYGRLGQWFWGFEQQEVVPDIVAVAKAMGNGHPLGAVITSRAIAERFRTQGYFFSSAGGSPVSCVVGLTVLDVLRDERLQENAATVGAHLARRLRELGDRHPLVGAVHGSGLYLGLEFVRDREALEPATEETRAICERLRELGVIVQPTSDRQCVLKIKPPLCLTIADADAFVERLDEVLTSGW